MEEHVNRPGHPPDVTAPTATKETDVIPVPLVTMVMIVVRIRLKYLSIFHVSLFLK